MTNDLIP